MAMLPDDDVLALHEEDEAVSPHALDLAEWKVLIVDDDEDVHRVTVFALAKTPILGRRLRFFHAYNAAQTIESLKAEPDIAVILLDVVMEQEDTGLTLARTIRETLALHDVRIVLRTGQPGSAPEIEVIRDYDINDYKLKSDMSRTALYATLTTSIRAYEQIRAISENRQGLNTIIEAGRRMLAHHSLPDYFRNILDEAGQILHCAPEGLVCTRGPSPADAIRIVATAGSFEPYADQLLTAINDSPLMSAIEQGFEARCNQFHPHFCTLHFPSKTTHEMVAFLATKVPPADIHRQLLAVFCTNTGLGGDFAQLFEQLHDQAYNDPLLRIPNRLDFMRTVGNAILTARQGQSIAVVDIDHFSQINDALGQRYGDALLKAVTARLLSDLPLGTVVARLASDTFGLLASDETIAPETLTRIFRTPFFVEGAEQSLTVTSGLARLSEIDGNGTEAVQCANIALSRAKSTARGESLYFERHMGFETRARLRLLRELRSAFDKERLFLVYQPQYDLRTKRVTGIEALLRWRTEEGNLIPPDRFIPLAENSGLIVALGAWVMQTACRDLKRLNDEGFDLRLAVNVSVMQFRHPDFIQTVDHALLEGRLQPRQLELEITETIAMLDADLMLSVLKELKARGVAIAIDDFGVGFSSLKYLEQFEVDRLKIDQSFIQQMMHSHSSQRIVETVVQLGQSLRLGITAEGVETEAQAAWLEQHGCHEAQGYLFAKPMTFRQLQSFLESQSMRRCTADMA